MPIVSKTVSARQSVYDRVLKHARQTGPGAKLPRVRDLTVSLGTSLATLDGALTQLERQGFIERRHGQGVFVTPRIAQQTLGVIFGRDIFSVGVSPFWALLFQSLTRQAAAKNHRLELFIDLPDDQHVTGHRAELLQRLAEHGLEGLLLANTQGPAEIEELGRQGVPLVTLMTGLPNSVSLDYGTLVAQGVAALAEQGCRRIGLITASAIPATEGVVADAFRAALAERHLPYLPAWRWEQRAFGPPLPGEEAWDTHEELGYRAIKQWVGMITPLEPSAAQLADNRLALIKAQFPDGLLITDDMLTRGALVALRKLGLVIGRDVRIATHANKGSSALLGHADEVTRLEFDPDEIAAAMLAMIEGLLDGKAANREVVTIQPRALTGMRREEGSA